MALLTKSKYLIGLQCKKTLWYLFNQPEKLPEVDEQTQYRFTQGYNVEKYAKMLFEGETTSDDFMNNIRKTKRLIQLKRTIFEAGIMIKSLYARADILRYNNGWELYEIKSSTSVKDIHIKDLAFQKYIFELTGLKIKKCFVIHINTGYIKNGEINLNKLLKITEIEINTNYVEENIKEMFEITKSKELPKDKCDNLNCEFCFPNIKDYEILDLYRIGKKFFDLYKLNIKNLIDIPNEFKLSDKQKIQVECSKTNKPYINKKEIKNWLNQLKEPLMYLDFESFQTAIPLYDNSRPYQQICFQYSLHKDNKHYEFLHNENNDPRINFIKKLINDLGNEGSIIVYNKSFEISRLKELAIDFPEYKNETDLIILRIVDLLDIFKNFWYYDKRQKGSASIKNVLPCFSDLSYNDLEIGNGFNASLEYLRMMNEELSNEEKLLIRNNLLEYCKQDTLAEVIILNQLIELVEFH
jgi:hypothetical protein